MARRMMVATVVASLALLAAGPASAQEEPLPPEEEKLERLDLLWVNGWEFVGGDGDNIAEPGERLELWVDLSHGGSEAVRDIAASLRSLSDEVRIIEGSARWDDIAGGEGGRNRVAFVIKVTEAAQMQDTSCGPVMIDPVPVEEPPSSGGGDDPVSSDGGTVSSDGSSSDGTVTHGTVEPDDGSGDGEPGDEGQTEPGTADPDAETLEAEKIEAQEADARAAEEERRAQETTTEETTVEDAPVDEDGREPAPDNIAGVHIALAMDVTSSAGEQELFIDNGIVCALADGLGAPTAGGADDLARQGGLAEEGAPVGSTSRAPAIGSAAVLLGAMALTLAAVARRRRMETQ